MSLGANSCAARIERGRDELVEVLPRRSTLSSVIEIYSCPVKLFSLLSHRAKMYVVLGFNPRRFMILKSMFGACFCVKNCDKHFIDFLLFSELPRTLVIVKLTSSPR